MSKVAVLIPTRLKSTRLPNKPLLKINGKPMIQHVYEHAIRVHPPEDVYIASGDQEIIDEALRFGAQCVLTDASLPSGTDRIAAALNTIDPTGQTVAVQRFEQCIQILFYKRCLRPAV